MEDFPTPPLRVSRPVSACSRCRTAKIKCDGKLPSCSACEKSGRGHECSSANDQFAKGKERNYVSSLEIRVEKLERQLAEARRRKISVTMLDLDTKQSTPPPSNRSVSRKPKSQRREASDVDDLVSDFGFLSVNATARDFHGFTREMSFARLVLSTSSLEPMPKATGATLPPNHTITPLIQYYLSNVFALFPFVSESAIFSALDALHDGGIHATAMDQWTVRMVTAISLASRSRKRGDGEYLDALTHAAEAFNYVEKVLQPGSITGIQALLLLLIYAMVDPHHFNSWYLVGIASRVMVDLGLHQDPPDILPSQKSQMETRRRVYHSVYALDRAISMVHRRAFSFTDDSTNVALDIATKEQIFRQALEPSRQLFRLRQLESSIYQQLFWSDREDTEDSWPVISKGLIEISGLADNLPKSMSASQRALLQSEILYFKNLILFAPKAGRSAEPYRNVMAFENVVQYAEKTSFITRHSHRLAFYTSHDLLRASYMAIRFLEILENATTTLLNRPMDLHSTEVASNEMPLPFPPHRGPEDVIETALGTIGLLDEILEDLCIQFGYSDPWQEFHAGSLSSMNMLQRHKERRATVVKIEPSQDLTPVVQEPVTPTIDQLIAPAADHSLSWATLQSSQYGVKPIDRT